jgi:hypothetical protein
MCNKLWWICENFRRSTEMIEKDHSFLVLNIVRLCVSLKIIFFRPMILLLDLMVEICFLNDLENFIVTQVMTRI